MTNNTIMMPFNGNSLPACTEWGSWFLLLVSSSNNFLFYLVRQEIRQDFLVKKSMDREEKHVSKVEKDPLVRQAMAMDPNAKQFYGVSEWDWESDWLKSILSIVLSLFYSHYSLQHIIPHVTYASYLHALHCSYSTKWKYKHMNLYCLH